MPNDAPSSREAPLLSTERLLLRPHHVDDFPACLAMWADPDVTRYLGGRPFSREESWARFLRYAGHWSLLGFGYWAVEERTTGHFVGEVGFADYRRDTRPACDDFPELGWAFASRVHGLGYSSESAQAVLT